MKLRRWILFDMKAVRTEGRKIERKVVRQTDRHTQEGRQAGR